MNKLMKNYIYNAMYQIFLIIVPLITAPLLSRRLGPVQLSTYGYISSIISIINSVGLLGLNTYAYRQVAYDRDNKEKLCMTFSEIFICRVCLLIFISVGYFLSIMKSVNQSYYLIEWLLVVAVFIDVSWLFIGVEDLGKVVFRNFLAKLLTVIIIIIFIKDERDLWIYFLSFSATTFITVLTMFPMLKKYVSFKRVNIKKAMQHLWPSVKLFIPQIATLLYLQVDKIMMRWLSADAGAIAYYDYAEKFINIPLAIITAFSTVFMPRIANLFANNEDKRISEYINKLISYSSFASIPLMFGMIGIASNLMPWYLGNSFDGVSMAVIILSPIVIINSLCNISGNQYFTATNKIKILCLAYYGAAIINLGLNAILIPKFSYVGAAIATVCCSLFSLISQYVYMSKMVNIQINRKLLFKYFSFGILMCVVTLIIGKCLGISWITTGFQIIVGGAVYLILLAISKDVILIDLVDQIQSMLTRKRRWK